MRLIDRLRAPEASSARSQWPGLSLDQYMTFLGNRYALGGSVGSNPAADFVGYVRDVGERNGLVYAAVTARAHLISQLRFVWRDSVTGELDRRRNLEILNRPGTMTRPELLYLAEEDRSYSGTFYGWRNGAEIHRLRPDWVKVVLGSDMGPVGDEKGWVPPDARIVGFTYQNPTQPNGKVQAFAPGEIIQWKAEPHPIEWWRGQSWVTSVTDEIRNDGQVTDHTSKFFRNAGTPNLIFTMDPSLSADQVEEYAELVNAQTQGAANAYKNLYLGGGASVDVVGAKEAALSTKEIQGGYESRIASAARVPAVILGIREGMDGSALNSGNYAQTRRLWADGWFTPSSQSLCASFERVVRPNAGSELWYDASEVLFLQEDAKDAAEIMATSLQAARAGVEAGYDPDSVTLAIATGDITKLTHTGVFSVQLQPPGSGEPDT